MKKLFGKILTVIAWIELIVLFPIGITLFVVMAIVSFSKPWDVMARYLAEYVWIVQGWYLKFNGITKEEAYQIILDNK